MYRKTIFIFMDNVELQSMCKYFFKIKINKKSVGTFANLFSRERVKKFRVYFIDDHCSPCALVFLQLSRSGKCFSCTAL